MKKILLIVSLIFCCLFTACGKSPVEEKQIPKTREITSVIFSSMLNGDVDTLFMNFYQPYDDFDIYEFSEYFYNTNLGSFVGIDMVELGTKFETCDDGNIRVVINTTAGEVIFFLTKVDDTYKFFVDEIYTDYRIKIPKNVDFCINGILIKEKPVNTITDEICTWDVYDIDFLCRGIHKVTLKTDIGDISTSVVIKDSSEIEVLNFSENFSGAYEIDSLIKESHNYFHNLAFYGEEDYSLIKNLCTESISDLMLQDFVQEIKDEADLTMNRWSRKYKDIVITNIDYTLIEPLSENTFYIEFDVTKTFKEKNVDGEYTGSANIIVKYDGDVWKIEQISNKTLYTSISSINTLKPLNIE